MRIVTRFLVLKPIPFYRFLQSLTGNSSRKPAGGTAVLSMLTACFDGAVSVFVAGFARRGTSNDFEKFDCIPTM